MSVRIGGDVVVDKDKGAGGCGAVIKEDVRVKGSPKGGGAGINGTDPGFL